MKQIEYVGCFFDPQQMQHIPVADRSGPLYRSIAAPHVTFSYLPQEVPVALFGTPIAVKAVGYGCDGQNEAIKVEFVDLPQALRKLAAQIPVPHITLSVAELALPFNSRHLDFRPIEPFLLQGCFGGVDMDGTVHTE